MLSDISTKTTRNSISGKVILKETGIGIPDLIVIIYDLDTVVGADGGTPTISRSASTPASNGADRIGSVLTSEDGSWALPYSDSEFRLSSPNEKRPDLWIQVQAPEDSDAGSPAILFNSKLPRAKSGRNEAAIIRITAKQLTDLGIPLPEADKEDMDPDSKVEKFRRKKTAQKKLRDDLRTINKEFDESENPETVKMKKTFKDALLPQKVVLDGMYNFVKDNETIDIVQDRVIKKGADDIDGQIAPPPPNNPVPGKGIKISLILTDDEKAALNAFKFSLDGKDYYNIPEAKITEILFKRENDDGISSILFSDNPISKFCIQQTVDEKCAKEHTGIIPPGDSDHDHDGGSGGGSTDGGSTPVNDSLGVTKEDLPKYLESILIDKDTDQFRSEKDHSGKRPTGESVQASVDSFALQKGPADTTAYFDFHSLQIAFQHVWQQLLDETLVNLGEKIHVEQENAGKKGLFTHINQFVTATVAPNFNNIMVATAEALKNSIEEVPTSVAAAFDISFLEWDALSADNKAKLISLATDINKYESDPPKPTKVDFGFLDYEINVGSPKEFTARAAMLREQGERIIDNIRINRPFSTNQLLKDLQERLLAKYEFTVFAADKNYHSVNFGLLNTYRQKWEPVSYQAGKLVKTIPLSPKEERKYSVKTTQTMKVTRKEAIKNNSMLHQEINTTSRAESEIVAKAHDKSNFNMSVKLDYSKISSEVKFGKDAEKDSSQTKKDFREAVIKAAQEFKEERSIDIDTEQTMASEYNESGTIVNPNDELSVTYLFYELQRRYRVSEQLYRVMPVVMVAQEVPSPDQINEAWIVAHDWILNRALLDDSFRPTLQYIAQKNVGDDYAIRESRKNLRQQRTLVTNLQVEFAKLQGVVDNKYAILQNRTTNRIDEEHNKRFYKWWWWLGHEKKDTPPDPEMAKAMEMAAADDHKHAVEQAEKMSMSVQREMNTLHQLTADYNAIMREHLDRITQCRRLVTHMKENILYYMQAIWSMEPPDQRFMRLFKVNVPYFEADRTCIIEDAPIEDIFEQFRKDGKKKHRGWLHAKVKRKADGVTPEVVQKQLVEIADLDTVLGFKGNYMIFPMKEHNALTQLMAGPYVDEAFGAMDPDELSNINLGEFSRYICCLHDTDPEEYERLKPVLKGWLEKLLADPLRNGDEIIVPTGSLFIEMLPSDKSLLEDFKLQHREWDVYKTQAEVRKLELENIRYAARLLSDEMEDPEIEKKILVTGNGQHTIVVDDN